MSEQESDQGINSTLCQEHFWGMIKKSPKIICALAPEWNYTTLHILGGSSKDEREEVSTNEDRRRRRKEERKKAFERLVQWELHGGGGGGFRMLENQNALL